MASAKVQDFCDMHDIGKRSAYLSALCLEEMAVNVVKHGFSRDKTRHSLDIRAIYNAGDMMLRLRDDCIPFDPAEMAEILNGDDSFENNGIRMVYRTADEVNYQNLLGMNVLTITIKEKDLRSSESSDYILEKTLQNMDEGLHRRFKDTVFVVQSILTRYMRLFPEYTDHSMFHSLTVIDACNRLIGLEQIKHLNKDEIYILLMGCYLHDVGMGISEKDFNEFKPAFNDKEYFEKHPDAAESDFVRDYHNEFSGMFIDKYAELLEIPSAGYTFAIKQVARGHRKTDLFDENEYPSDYRLENGNTVCLPYLAALIRLADEIDVVATRNPILLYDLGAFTDNVRQMRENKKLEAIKAMTMTREAFILTAETEEESVYKDLTEMIDKMQKTLDLCQDVIRERTNYRLSQEKIILRSGDRIYSSKS
jgi:anti-sigma regulatory factor (Ser/Thr protein kinase)